MGLLRALIEATERLQNEKVFKELGLGFDYRPINWVIELDSGSDKLSLKGRYKDEMIRCVPMRADRSGKPSKDNIKPNLFVDNARYALGLAEGGAASEEFKSFRKLHELALETLSKFGENQGSDVTGREETEAQLNIILAYLRLSAEERKKRLEGAERDEPRQPKSAGKAKKKGKEETTAKLPDERDIVAFATTKRYPFDGEFARVFWMQHLQQECSEEIGVCSACGDTEEKPLLRIFPFKIRLFGERCPILSVNTDEQHSFGSLGKGQLSNSPICIECAGKADRVLKFLIQLEKGDNGEEKSSGRHAVILARDSKQALGNQIAVFWTKELMERESREGEKITFDELAKSPIEEFDQIPENSPPVKAGQVRDLLKAPFCSHAGGLSLPTNRFYFAIFSPNKSRLVVREWLETDIEPVRENIKHYLDSLQIIHPDGRGVWWPPLYAAQNHTGMLEGLRSYTSTRQKGKESPRIPALGPDAIRKLIRCIYTGTPPPEVLLARALRCFRVPDPPAEDREQRERQMLRRMAMAAAMKLVLTYRKNEKEQRAMEKLETEHDGTSDYKRRAPYYCGCLLAILEAAQRGPFGKDVNTTLVDRFYGAASTAPATVFANLINMATKAHLPKLRREGREIFKLRSGENVNINDLVTEACSAIDAAGGFPPPLTPQQQAEFALGFYHQRAELNSPKTQSKSSSTDATKPKGDQQ